MTETCNIPDVQGREDDRRVAIQRVGVKDVPHPVVIELEDGSTQATAAMVDMSVALSADYKGTHMSRFMEMLNERELRICDRDLRTLMQDMLARLHAEEGTASFRFPLFLRKKAPVSGVESMLDYQIEMTADCTNGEIRILRRITVPVKTLCPCSRDISEYGAHNQRSHVTVTLADQTELTTSALIKLIEGQASSELFGILKRADEKHVTERAYENPKFVEDLVRDAAIALDNAGAREYTLEVENFESIHNHSAYARIVRD